MEEFFKKYNGKKVLVTGHTGFKGSWLSLMLQMAGAEVIGYALEPQLVEHGGDGANQSLFRLAKLEQNMKSVIGDIRDYEKLSDTFQKYRPEYVFHLAAQPIVRESYRDPVGTYSTNVMGTVNVLDCVRNCDSVRSVLNVTTDKVYLNLESEVGFREDDKLDGYDPYSNSKSCSELVTHSYEKSFLHDMDIRVSTARAGNVIGGGDFEKDRIIPDCVRAALAEETIVVRNPYSVRPFQHVLEPLYVYLMIVQKQLEDPKYAGAYNVGPMESDCWTTGQLVDCFCKNWGAGLTWKNQNMGGPHEAGLLRLDCTKLRETFAWKSQWSVETAIQKIVEWTHVYREGGDVKACMEAQIREYLQGYIE